MRVLLIKTSSMGDLIHTFPALTDAARAIPGIQFDWLVEDAFADIPSWHPAVNRVIPVALRRWRKNIFARETRVELNALRQQLRQQKYDVILDAQSLLKSAFLVFFAKGERVGLDFRSARESLASLFYQRKCTVNFYQHAVVRMRSLFSQALAYSLPNTLPDFGLNHRAFHTDAFTDNYLVFLHGTSWTSKLWPEQYWIELAQLAKTAGLRIKVSYNGAEEKARVQRLAENCEAIDVLPNLNITEMAQLLAAAKGAVAVDTGFGHLSAALAIPTVSLYGSTNPDYTGALGAASLHLKANFACSPCLSRNCHYQKAAEVVPACYVTIKPSTVWMTLQTLLS